MFRSRTLLVLFATFFFTQCSVKKESEKVVTLANYSNLKEYFQAQKWDYPICLNYPIPTIIINFGVGDTIKVNTLSRPIVKKIREMDSLYRDSNNFKKILVSLLLPKDTNNTMAFKFYKARITIDTNQFRGTTKENPSIYLEVNTCRFIWNKHREAYPNEDCGFMDSTKKVIYCPGELVFRLNETEDSLVFKFWDN
jgi:hypothetical protein